MEDPSPCQNVTTWEEEFYWKHFHTFHFYQILPKDFLHHLVLPAKFAERMSCTLRQKVSLIGPSGSAWDVEVSKTGSLALVGDGWKGFAEAYALEEKSLLLFKYKLNSSFEVLIFDKESLCEKEAAYFAKKNLEKIPDQSIDKKRKVSELSSTEVLEDFDDDDGGGGASEFVSSKKPDEDVVDEVVCHRDRHWRITEALNIPSDEYSEDDCNDPDFILSSQSYGGVLKSRVSKKYAAQGGKTQRSLATYSPQSAKKQDPDMVTEGAALGTPNRYDVADVSPSIAFLKAVSWNNGVSAKSIARRRRSRPMKRCRKSAVSIKRSPLCNYISNRRPVTEEEKQVAYNRATERLTEKSFLAVMCLSCVYKRFYMNIPSTWKQKHLPHGYYAVTLRLGEKTWKVMFAGYKNRYCGGFSVRWKNFALENNLEEDDVCVFTLISEKDDATLIFDVEIFRVVEEILPLSRVF